MDIEALFRISYGLYLISSGNREQGNGFIANAFFQVTSEPPRFALACNKDNHTAGLIQTTKAFAASVLHKDTDSSIFGCFGYKSGKDFDKMSSADISYGITGVPIVLNDAIATFEFRLQETHDLGTHWLFVADLQQATLIDQTREPITYLYYREVKKGLAPKNAPTYIDKTKLTEGPSVATGKKFKCTVCGYIHDEAVEAHTFAELSDDWVCPICSAEKDDFVEIC